MRSNWTSRSWEPRWGGQIGVISTQKINLLNSLYHTTGQEGLLGLKQRSRLSQYTIRPNQFHPRSCKFLTGHKSLEPSTFLPNRQDMVWAEGMNGWLWGPFFCLRGRTLFIEVYRAAAFAFVVILARCQHMILSVVECSFKGHVIIS